MVHAQVHERAVRTSEQLLCLECENAPKHPVPSHSHETTLLEAKFLLSLKNFGKIVKKY